MSGTTTQSIITNGVVAQDIARARQELRAAQAIGQAVNRVGRAIARETAKLLTIEERMKFFAMLAPVVVAETEGTLDKLKALKAQSQEKT